MHKRYVLLFTHWPTNKCLKNRYLALFLVIIFVNLIQGCTSTGYSKKNKINEKPITDSNLQARKTKLLAIYQIWQDTPYRLGGNSITGVDCSAFVRHAYQEISSYKLPRTTQYQVLLGKSVNQQQMVVGDLVFFKTNAKTRHVGIYIDDEQFLHASTSKGVTISKLTNNYWQRHYWKTRRLLSQTD